MGWYVNHERVLIIIKDMKKKDKKVEKKNQKTALSVFSFQPRGFPSTWEAKVR